jgi:peptidoglycan/LPS O-acetylase OafA/YrhL
MLALGMKRIVWIDLAKGLAILWVVYFHFFTTYIIATPSPMAGHFMADVAGAHGWDNPAASLATLGRIVWFAISQAGYHAVGVFIMLSGWSLAATTWRKAEKAPIKWGSWYWARFIRLYPMYWVAHLVLLLTPFTWLEPIDYRFLISLTGLRMIQIESIFVYGNAAWWFFALLIQLVAIFPLLFWVLRRLGPWPFFLFAVVVGFAVRYVQLVVWQSNGSWTLGGFALARLPEFALGMALGIAHLQNREGVERFILGVPAILMGLFLYWFAPVFFTGLIPYVGADLYTGACCFLVVIGLCGLLEKSPFIAKWLGLVGVFSYGVYLIHQPFVIWIGLAIRGFPEWAFFLIAAGVLIVMSAAGIFLEKQINRLVDWLVGGKETAKKTNTP